MGRDGCWKIPATSTNPDLRQEYVYVERPVGRLRDKLDIAVDCLCRMSLGACTHPSTKRDRVLGCPMLASAYILLVPNA